MQADPTVNECVSCGTPMQKAGMPLWIGWWWCPGCKRHWARSRQQLAAERPEAL